MSNTPMAPSGQKREHFRLTPDIPFCANMTIVHMNGNDVQCGSTKVCVDNISATGLKFVTNLRFPVSERVLLTFELRLNNEKIKLLGYIVRRDQDSDGLYHYGVAFCTTQNSETVKLTRLLNHLSIIMKKNKRPVSCNFCTEQIMRGCWLSDDASQPSSK